MRRGATGLIAWITQRISALFIALFTLYLLYVFLCNPPEGYLQWHVFILSPFNSIAALLFMLSLLLHAWIGIRDVVIDYVHPFAIRLGLLSLLMGGLIACGVWALQILMTTTHI